MLENANIFVTGGAGTLGHAIARRRKQDKWTGRLTVYSTDSIKHELMRREYPDISFIQGDIRSGDMLYQAMVGHDVVIHAAAVKVIPVSEFQSIDTFDVNVNGSQNVCHCAVAANVQHVLGISTDKACYPVNTYGATKLLMEKIFQEFARQPFETQFHLTRYGNVLESRGSVIEAWKRAAKNGEPIKMTDPDMTRFWLSPSQAVQYLIDAFKFESGWNFIPNLPSLSIRKLAEYTVAYVGSNMISERPIEIIPLRPGEKKHETLLTVEEGWYAKQVLMGTRETSREGYILRPTTSERNVIPCQPFTSDIAKELTQPELLALLADD